MCTERDEVCFSSFLVTLFHHVVAGILEFQLTQIL